jgi:hypothetical protein
MMDKKGRYIPLNDKYYRDQQKCGESRECREDSEGCEFDSQCQQFFCRIKPLEGESHLSETEIQAIINPKIAISLSDVFTEDGNIYIVEKVIPETPHPRIDYNFIIQLLHTLTHLQDHQIIHNHIQPDNIVYSQQAGLSILKNFVHLSQANEEINYASDIFSLGKTIEHLLPPELSTSHLKAVINKSTQLEASKRYQSAREMLIALGFSNAEEILNTTHNLVNPLAKLGGKNSAELTHRLQERIYDIILKESQPLCLDKPRKYGKTVEDILKNNILYNWETLDNMDLSQEEDEQKKKLYQLLINNVYTKIRKLKTAENIKATISQELRLDFPDADADTIHNLFFSSYKILIVETTSPQISSGINWRNIIPYFFLPLLLLGAFWLYKNTKNTPSSSEIPLPPDWQPLTKSTEQQISADFNGDGIVDVVRSLSSSTSPRSIWVSVSQNSGEFIHHQILSSANNYEISPLKSIEKLKKICPSKPEGEPCALPDRPDKDLGNIRKDLPGITLRQGSAPEIYFYWDDNQKTFHEIKQITW